MKKGRINEITAICSKACSPYFFHFECILKRDDRPELTLFFLPVISRRAKIHVCLRHRKSPKDPFYAWLSGFPTVMRSPPFPKLSICDR